MIGYVTLGTNDLEKSRAFYAPLMEELGIALVRETEKSLSWGTFGAGGGLSVTKPFDGQAANFGNGTMIALEASGRQQVDRIYSIAMSNGAVDEGEPDFRAGSTFYGAYFRDPDGNKLCIYKMPAD